MGLNKGKRVLLAVAIGATLFGVAAYSALRPKWVTASRAEVDQLLDPLLRGEFTADRVKRERFVRLEGILKRVTDDGLEPPASVPGAPFAGAAAPSLDAAIQFTEKNRKTLNELSSLIEEGPYQAEHSLASLGSFPAFPGKKRVVKALLAAARIYAREGKESSAIELIDLAHRFVGREFESSNTLIELLIAIAESAMVDETVAREIEAGRFSEASLKRLLKIYSRVFNYKQTLTNCILGEFKIYGYPLLPDPRPVWKTMSISAVVAPEEDRVTDHEDPAGNYDALATAEAENLTTLESLANVSRPPGRVVTTYETKYERLVSALPEDRSAEQDGVRKEWERFRYRFAMSRIPNSAGLSLVLMSGVGSRHLSVMRAKTEATAALVRLELALACFEKSKKRLPNSLSELVEEGFISAVPTDPFVDRPIRYDRSRRLIWSVGENLTDDSGSALRNRDTRALDLICRLP